MNTKKIKNVEHARQVLVEAQTLGLDFGGIPETNEEVIDKAQKLYEFAVQAREEGMNGEHVTTIINVSESGEVFEDDKTEDKQTVESSLDKIFYSESIRDRLPENLPVPHEIEGEAPSLPLELTDLSDNELMRLHGAFTACAARVGWLYAIEEAGEAAARLIAGKKISDYITNASKKDEETNKPKTMEVLRGEARYYDEEVDYWLTLKEKHEVEAKRYKEVTEIFNNNVERLSRAWTMRVQERGI